MANETDKELSLLVKRLRKAVEQHSMAPYSACYVLDGSEASMVTEALKQLLPPKRLVRFCIDKTRKNSAGYAYVSFVTKLEGEPDSDLSTMFPCAGMEYFGPWIETPED
jgi:hypothetical protein